MRRIFANAIFWRACHARALIGLLAPLWVAYAGATTAKPIDAPNAVAATSQFITSGQPPASALGRLKEDGFQAVIFLVPDGVRGNVANEAEIVRAQGLTFIHIPIKFDQPTPMHYSAFAAAMRGLKDKKVLVHCEVNLRASSMVFLYRTIELKQSPETAYNAVTAVWQPRYAWKPYIEEMLNTNGIEFTLD
jgi:protein tyrosine phosphatase (PTP) superfamily phosphohydrolase (DUF442 family)